MPVLKLSGVQSSWLIFSQSSWLIFSPMCTCYMQLFLPTDDGTEQLDWVEFAHVFEDGDDYMFEYIDGEDESTTWPGEGLQFMLPYCMHGMAFQTVM